MIMVVLEGFIVAYSFINLILMIKKYKRFHSIYPVIAVFDLVMVVPLFLEMYFGIPDIPRDVYMNFVRAMEDQTTLLIYCLFVLLAQLMFTCELRRIKRLDRSVTRTNDIQEFLLFIQDFKYRKIVVGICYIIVAASVFSVIVAPNPMYYLTFRNVHIQVSDSIARYSEHVILPLFELLVGAIIALKLFDSKNKIGGVVFRIILIVFFTVVNGKRTYLMIIIGVFFLIDLLKQGSLKKIAPKYVFLFGMVAVYFYGYMYITDKISYNSDWYYEMQEYIFRSMHVRFSIYATLHPEKIHILDYPGQSMLSNLFFFIPRAIWISKPSPYIDYYMRGVLGSSSLSNVTYNMPASYYPEFVSNFGILGLALSLIFTIWIMRYFDKRKTACKLLGTALIALLNVYYYNDLLKMVAMFILYLCITEKYRFVIGRR